MSFHDKIEDVTIVDIFTNLPTYVWCSQTSFVHIMASVVACCCFVYAVWTSYQSSLMFKDQHVTWFNPDAPSVSGRRCHIDWRPFHVTYHVDLTPFIATLPRSKYAQLSC